MASEAKVLAHRDAEVPGGAWARCASRPIQSRAHQSTTQLPSKPQGSEERHAQGLAPHAHFPKSRGDEGYGAQIIHVCLSA